MTTHHRRTRAAFSFVEVLFAMSIGASALGMATFAVVEAGRSLYDSTKRLELNGQIRNLTARLAKETIDANQFYVLSNYLALNGNADLTGADDDSAAINTPLPSGSSGDCILLEYRGDPDNRSAITRIRVYFRDTTAATTGAAIRSVEVQVPAASQTLPLNTIVNTIVPRLSSLHAAQRLVTGTGILAHGIRPVGGDTVLPVFYNDSSRAVSINLRLETPGANSGVARRSASSFNFTISPRR